jgi:hypothetical protein
MEFPVGEEMSGLITFALRVAGVLSGCMEDEIAWSALVSRNGRLHSPIASA